MTGRWLQFGDGTLRESWASNSSHNHIMFGDLSAWAYEYALRLKPPKCAMRRLIWGRIVHIYESISPNHDEYGIIVAS